MISHKAHEISAGKSPLRWIYILTLLMMTLSGFGQMPIFKRYYIADIPGMGWLAEFYLTHYMHYLGAILLIGLFAYFIADYLLLGRKEFRLTASAYIRMVLMGGIVFTGIIRVMKNLPDVVFSPGFTLFIDISHLGFMMVYLLTALVFLIIKSSWVVGK
jgi:hypothetical protein